MNTQSRRNSELDISLLAAHVGLTAPPLGTLLEDELGDLRPMSPRRPWRDVVSVASAATTMIALLILVLRARRDLDGLPTGWLVGHGAAWVLCFAALSVLALVPRTGAVVPRWMLIIVLAALAAVGFIVAGFTLARTTPLSFVYEPTLANHLRHAAICLSRGTATAIIPLLLGARLLRGAVPVGARAIGAGLGAACGAAGGLMLHLHCPITHELHVAVGHGATISVCALLGALIVPALARVR